MKYLLISVILFAISWQASAQDRYQVCEGVKEYARAVMKLRQDGMISQRPLISEDPYSSLWVMQDHIISEAYSSPLMPNDELKDWAVCQFEDRIFLECMLPSQ